MIDVLEKYTYDDYVLWKGDWELIDGIPQAMSPSPVRSHQSLVTQFIIALNENLEECPECEVVSELDYIIDDENVLRPDVALICLEENDFITKAPKIIVEVLSPSTAKRDEKVKFAIYEKEKVHYYVIVNPKTLIAKVYKLENNIYQKQGDFSREKYNFDELECPVEVDFEVVFKRFRK